MKGFIEVTEVGVGEVLVNIESIVEIYTGSKGYTILLLQGGMHIEVRESYDWVRNLLENMP
jgi:hypothetical protein